MQADLRARRGRRASSPTAGQHCRVVTWLESRPMPMGCGDSICFTYVAVTRYSTVCD